MRPFFWQDVPGFFDFDDIYDEAAFAARPGGMLVEVGTFFGRSTLYLASALRARSGWGVRARLFAIDKMTYLPDVSAFSNHTPEMVELMRVHGSRRAVFDYFTSRLGLEGHVTPLIGDGATAASWFPDESVDFVFLDGDHGYDTVSAELRAWLPKVAPGGLIGGHDYGNPACPGVRRAADEAFGRALEVRGPSFLYRKTWKL